MSLVVSQIIEATNFPQNGSRVDFNIPKLLCGKIRLCHLGVYGAESQPLDPVLGQLSCIKKIVLRDGGVVLSQYDRNIKSAMKLKLLATTTNDDFKVKRRNVDGSFAGLELRRAGENSASQPAVAGRTMEADVIPKICVDKKDPPRIAAAEADTRFATLDLADVLGWCSAVYTAGSTQMSGVMPCHIHNQLKLSVEFDATQVVDAGCVMAQPYLIFHEVQDPKLEQSFMNPNLVAQYADWELESVYLGNGIQSKVFLNSFFNKTLSKLAMICDIDGSGQSEALGGEVLRLLVNNVPYFQLTTGLNHEAKKAAFTRLAGFEFPIALHSDKQLDTVPVSWPANPDADATSICEGANANDQSGSLWYRANNSYLVLDINQRINNMQIDYSITAAAPANLTLQFWGQVEKLVKYSSNAPLVAYA